MKDFLIQLEQILEFFKILENFIHWNLQMFCLCVIASMPQRFGKI